MGMIRLFYPAIRDVREKIPGLSLYQWSELPDTPRLDGAIDLNVEISSIDPGPLVDDLALGTPRDKLIYIYTSGTTGMPKAAVITNLRYEVSLIASSRVHENKINCVLLKHDFVTILGTYRCNL